MLQHFRVWNVLCIRLLEKSHSVLYILCFEMVALHTEHKQNVNALSSIYIYCPFMQLTPINFVLALVHHICKYVGEESVFKFIERLKNAVRMGDRKLTEKNAINSIFISHLVRFYNWTLKIWLNCQFTLNIWEWNWKEYPIGSINLILWLKVPFWIQLI